MASEVKQIICMRTDLNMRKGKMIAQGAHSSIAFLTNKMQNMDFHNANPGETGRINLSTVRLTNAERAWIEGRFTKICVRVDSEEELLNIHARAIEVGLVCHLIQDAGLTEFKDDDGNAVPTYTCLAVGPDYEERINPITGHLTLL